MFTDYVKYNSKTVCVVRVLDGDTVWVDIPGHTGDHTIIRLIGVRAPELPYFGHSKEPWATESWMFLRNVIWKQQVTLCLNQYHTRDKYHRVLAYLTTMDGVEVNQFMIATGNALAYRKFFNPRKWDYVYAEREAKREHRGLWSATQAPFKQRF